jgi:hypothetical protein
VFFSERRPTSLAIARGSPGYTFYGTNVNRKGIKDGDTFQVNLTNFPKDKEVDVDAAIK